MRKVYIEKGPFPKEKTTLNITPQGTNKGWRLALRHALGDVAQHEIFKPRQPQSKKQSTEKDPAQGTFSLFDFE